MGKARKPATYADIEALPEGWVGEILEEELVASPRPAMGHAHVASSLMGILWGGSFSLGQGGPGGWWILVEPEVHLGRDVLVPDLAGWRRERLPRLPSPQEPFMTLAPDWVCEVLSPSTAFLDRSRKLSRYHQEGVRHMWLVDPLVRTLEVFRAEPTGLRLLTLHGNSEVVRVEPFEVLPLDLGTLWLGG